jgi:hypothetical protein
LQDMPQRCPRSTVASSKERVASTRRRSGSWYSPIASCDLLSQGTIDRGWTQGRRKAGLILQEYHRQVSAVEK